jgi:hypothetical protein
MSNVVNFPVCLYLKSRQRHCYGGRAFKTNQEAVDSMSDRDWRRVVQWEDRHAEYVARYGVKQA